MSKTFVWRMTDLSAGTV